MLEDELQGSGEPAVELSTLIASLIFQGGWLTFTHSKIGNFTRPLADHPETTTSGVFQSI